ncbi:hypothetical protein [Trichloromonas sp.]|uniref:hypothetical protein n=1 Tax=Trichloromonas sp. TaxID=3069249 RepID=UPI003D814631
MRVWQSFIRGLLLMPLVLCLAAPAGAASVSGRASTLLEWYDTATEDTSMPLYQYLQLNVKDLGAQGYNFKVYGRLGDDLNDEEAAKSRLYYAYLEKKDLFKGLGFRLGRQFISTTAGASLMDGLSLDYTLLEDYKVKVFGGGDVSYYQGYNVKDTIVGVEVSGQFCDSLDLAASYLQKWDGGLLGQELVGFDASYDLDGKLWLYNELQWDILSERLSYAQLGGKYRFDAPFTVRLEYLYSLPVFSSTSIYSVFAVEDYEEVLAEVTYRLQRGLQVFGRYTREIYDEYDDANLFEAGIEKLRTGKFSGYLTGIYRSDDGGQDLKGFKVRTAYKFTPMVEAGVGMNLDVLERQIDYFDSDSASDDTTSRRYWADVSLHLSKTMSVEGKVERVDSELWDYYNRGSLRFNVLF